jgi:hypothetical protein
MQHRVIFFLRVLRDPMIIITALSRSDSSHRLLQRGMPIVGQVGQLVEKHGSKIGAKDFAGKTAFALAKAVGHQEALVPLVRCLVEDRYSDRIWRQVFDGF